VRQTPAPSILAASIHSCGISQAAILQAEGEQQAQLLRAQGYSASLKEIEAQAHAVGNNTMYLQYMTTLRDIGVSPATKFVLPMELINMTQQFAGAMFNGKE
jgi:regulator of protease activity HflC (stomatin/prohibitin superfamily)